MRAAGVGGATRARRELLGAAGLPWLSRGAAGGPGGARRLRPQRTRREAGGAAGPEQRARTGLEPGTSWDLGEAGVARKGTLRAGGRLLSLWCDRSSCPGRDSVFLKRGCSNAGDYLSPSDLLPQPSAPTPPSAHAGPPQLQKSDPSPHAGCQQRVVNGAPASLRGVFQDQPLCKATTSDIRSPRSGLTHSIP